MLNIKEKILDTVYKKMCQGFRTDFFPTKQFLSEFSKQYEHILNSFALPVKEYYELKKSGDQEVVKTAKDKYILEMFNAHSSWNTYKLADLKKLKIDNSYDYNNFAEDYDNKLKYGQEVAISLFDFIKIRTLNNISSSEGDKPLFVRKFWDYYHKTYSDYYISDERLNAPEEIIDDFKELYLKSGYLRLFDQAESIIEDINFTGFETYVVNVGTREVEYGRSGWITNNFSIINNGKEYSFSSSSKDERSIAGEFVSIFILQSNKKHLVKISISYDETEQTPFIIYKDCEKVSLKNECEIFISKHHGNETIIFDTRKEALEFQSKILEIREGRNNRPNVGR